MLEAGRQDMLETNRRQRDFYESRHSAARSGGGEPDANVATNMWTRLRRRQQLLRRHLGISGEVHALHRRWINEMPVAAPRILDLGCFSGNPLSFELARHAERYVGIDLSESAIASLRRRLAEREIVGAEAKAMDFLENDFPPESFDLVYAHSVLHHFRHLPVALDEILRLLAPGGMVITVDPLNTSFSSRLARRIYRPLQSDRDWEFPFTRRTLRAIRGRFVIEELRGFMGCAKYSLPLMLVPGLRRTGERGSSLGARMDARYATREGAMLWRCMQVTLLLREPSNRGTAPSSSRSIPAA